MSFAVPVRLACAALAFVMFAPPRPAPSGSIAIDSEPPARDFIMGHANAENAAARRAALSNITLTTLPSISIYSPDGDLVYDGGGEVRDRSFELLRSFPASVKAMAPIPNRPSLKTMLDMVPDFKAREPEILAGHRYVVYAVTMKQGIVTSTERAIDELRERPSAGPVDTLLLRLQP